MTFVAVKPYVVINIDDIGMCHGANAAFVALSKAGRVDSGSLMVPCPWYSEMVELGLGDRSLKIGVHLTLNAEKKHYRWRPLTKATKASGLVDADGFLWRSVPELRRNAAPEAVAAEMRAQIETFLASGLKPAHIDGHMGAALSPEFYDAYLALAEEFDIPALRPAGVDVYGPKHNLGAVEKYFYVMRADRLRREGKALVDRVLETPWTLDGDVRERYGALFGGIGPGLNFFALHANAPGDIEAIEATAQIRIQEFEFLASDAFGRWLEKQDFMRGVLPA
jgi:predicted glycoside hydrolase/deacetylase ChbG (UPF0249 family)